MKASDKKTDLTAKDFEKLGRDFWIIYESNYATRKRALWFVFFKGLVYGFGIFLGGTILVASLLWFLTFFDEVPLLSPVIEKLNNVLVDPTTPANNVNQQ